MRRPRTRRVVRVASTRRRHANRRRLAEPHLVRREGRAAALNVPKRRRAAGRVIAGAIAGVPVAMVAAFFVPWQAAVLIGWIASAAVYLARVWWHVLPKNEQLTAEHATAYDDSRVLSDLLLLTAAVATLVAVALLLVKAGAAGNAK